MKWPTIDHIIVDAFTYLEDVSEPFSEFFLINREFFVDFIFLITDPRH